MFRIKSPLFAVLIVTTILTGCSSGKSAFEHGNYYEAVLTSVNRLRKNDDHAKSIETLRQAYPMAVQFYEDRAKASITSNAEFKWTSVVESYTTINVMYDEIRRCPGALKVIPNPLNYYAKLDEAKKNAAEENYAAGITAMTFATRDKAKSAYYLFKKANDYVPGYKDVIKMTETARWNATVKVVMEPIPVQAKNISVSAQFFDDKVSEYIHSASINEFVKFYTRKEAQTMKLNPDHIIKIDFDEFVVGQVYMNEKETRLERDSVVVSSYLTQSVTNSGGKTGTTTSGTTSGTTSATSGTTGTTSGTTGSTSGTSGTSGTVGGSKAGGSNTKGPGSSGTTGSTTSGTTGTKTNGASGSNTSGTSGASDKTSDADNEKVTVCHIPPGNASNPHSLVIARSALKAHLAHGDKEGSCDEGKSKANGDKSNDKPKDDKVADKKDDKAEDKAKDDKQKEDKTDKADDKSKDDKSTEGKPEDKSKEDKQKDEKADDKSVDKSKDDKSSDGKPEDKSKDEKSKDEKSKDEKSKDEKSKDSKDKPKDDKSKDKKSGGDGQALSATRPIFYASAKNDLKWLDYSNLEDVNDTVKVYATVKATLYHYKKTTTSKGIITFRIIDAKTNALLSVEKMPGEYVWISEWATFNGDERALTREQIQLTKQREKTPPPAQDLFIEFARPIYDQVVTKIKNFYTGY